MISPQYMDKYSECMPGFTTGAIIGGVVGSSFGARCIMLTGFEGFNALRFLVESTGIGVFAGGTAGAIVHGLKTNPH